MENQFGFIADDDTAGKLGFVPDEGPTDTGSDINTFVGPRDDRGVIQKLADAHPTLRRIGQELLSAGSSPEGQKASADFFGGEWDKHPNDQTREEYINTHSHPLGEGMMKTPGVQALGESIKNKGINSGNWWGGFLGDVGSQILDLVAGAADPRAVFTKPYENPTVGRLNRIIEADDKIPHAPAPPSKQPTINRAEAGKPFTKLAIPPEDATLKSVLGPTMDSNRFDTVTESVPGIPTRMERYGADEPALPYPLNVVPQRFHPTNDFFERNVPAALQERTGDVGALVNTPDELITKRILKDLPASADVKAAYDEAAGKLKPLETSPDSPIAVPVESGSITPETAPADKMVPVTRITDANLPIESDKPETWFVLGHMNDEGAAKLNDMYKSGAGKVTRTYIPESLVDTSADMSDEFGNKIIKVPTDQLKSGKLTTTVAEVPKSTVVSDSTAARYNDFMKRAWDDTGAVGDVAGARESRLKKLAEDETGAIYLRGKKKSDIEEMRNGIIDAVVSRPNIGLDDLYTTVKDKISPNQFEKLLNDIMDTGDINKAISKRKGEIKAQQLAEQRNPVSPNEEAIRRLLTNVQEHVIGREEQDALVSAEKSRRIRAASKVNTPGTEGYYEKLRQLKGEYPKVDVATVQGGINPEDVNSITQTIRNQPDLTDFQKITAEGAFNKIIGTVRGRGSLQPSEIELLSHVFGEQATDQLLELHGALGFALPPDMNKVVKALSYAKSAKSAGDIGWPLRQAINYVGRPDWFRAIGSSLPAYFSEAKGVGSLEALKAHPLYDTAREAGLAITDFRKHGSLKEESFPEAFRNWEGQSKLKKAALVPIRASDRAMTVGLDQLRMLTFDKKYKLYQDLYDSMRKEGISTGNKDLIKEADQFNPAHPYRAEKIADEINTSTGRGDLPRWMAGSEKMLNHVMFSPRMVSSRIKTFNRVFNPLTYVKMDKIQRVEALKQLVSIGGTIALSDLLLNKGMGAKVGDNPAASDFLKAKVGDTHVDASGSLLSYAYPIVRLLTNTMSTNDGKLQYLNGYGTPSGAETAFNTLAGNRPSPVMSAVEAIFNRSEFGGKPLNFTTLNPMENTATRALAVPMMVQDMYDLFQSNPELAPWMAIPDVMGMGVNTYEKPEKQPRKPKLELRKYGPLTLPAREGQSLLGGILSDFGVDGSSLPSIPGQPKDN